MDEPVDGHDGNFGGGRNGFGSMILYLIKLNQIQGQGRQEH